MDLIYRKVGMRRRTLGVMLLLFCVAIMTKGQEVIVDKVVYTIRGEEAVVTGVEDRNLSEAFILESVLHEGIPYPVTTIGASAFADCSSLFSLTLPTGLSDIGAYAFSNTALASITIPATVTSIGDYAFSGSSLIFVTIPETVTNVGECVFAYCPSLMSATIHSGMTSISLGFFRECVSLVSVVLPENLSRIGDYAFSSCPLASFAIPSGVKRIGRNAFSDCPLASIVIPANVTTIGIAAFSGCNSLSSIEVESDNESYCSVDGVLFSKDMTTLHTYPAGKALASYVVPESVTNIKEYAFGYNPFLASVTIPEGVTSIGGYTFMGCQSLASVELPEQVTDIGTYAFNGCLSLVSMVIPEKVTSIGSAAFWGCLLSEVHACPSVPPVIRQQGFDSDTRANALLHIPSGCEEAYLMASGWDFLTVRSDLPNSISTHSVFDDIVYKDGQLCFPADMRADITVYDRTGRPLQHMQAIGKADITDLPVGFHIIKVELTDGKTRVMKIIR